ncbi:beta-lactamase family protein, partial [candidate division KSB1 bacterium]|nr:beta-lactamase family protein [candidate division KSB1 bacterium]
PFPPEQLVGSILDQQPLFAAGEGWSYSDTGYILVGLIIESVTGRRYEQQLAERFLQPLNLTRTEPSNRLQLSGLAAGYPSTDRCFGLPPKTTLADGRMAWNPGIEWCGGGLVSNPQDLVRWAKALYEDCALPESYVHELLKKTAVDSERPNVGYGLGTAIVENPELGTVYGHKGWIPGYVSSLCYYAEKKSAIAVQINTDIGLLDSLSALAEIEMRLARAVLQAPGQTF